MRTNLTRHAEMGAHLGAELGRLPIEAGTAWAFVPRELRDADLGLDPERIESGTLRGLGGDSWEATADWLHEALNTDDPGYLRIVAFEEWIVAAEEVKADEHGIFFCEGKVVSYALPGADLRTVAGAMQGFYPSVGVLARVEETAFRPAERADVAAAELARLAAGAVAIIVASFDDEGWVVWERGDGGGTFRVRARPLVARQGIELDHALRLAASLEDDEVLRDGDRKPGRIADGTFGEGT